MTKREVELLKAKLEASELRHRVSELTSVVAQMQKELKESNKLLRQQRLPPRIRVSSTERMQLAASQKFICDGGDDCPLKKINPPGVFTEALWIVDHINPWCKSGKHTSNLHCLCPYCDSRKQKDEIVSQAYRKDLSDSDELSE